MSLRSTLGLGRESSLEEGTPDEVIEKKRRALDQRLRPARLEVARRHPRWREIADDLVPRGRGWLVSASTDAIYAPTRGVVFAPYSVNIVADQSELAFLRRPRRGARLPRADPWNLDRARRTPRAAEASGVRVLLRFTPAYDPHVLVDRPDLARDLMVDRGGLRMLPGQDLIPVVVDHDMDQRVGVVRSMFTDTDTDGRRWNFASVTLDPNPPEWLKRGTPVSWGYKAFGTREAAWGSKTKHITDAFIEEISVLRLLDPAEKLAKVLWVGEITEPPKRSAVRTVYTREQMAYAEEAGKRGCIVRHGIGQVLGVR